MLTLKGDFNLANDEEIKLTIMMVDSKVINVMIQEIYNLTFLLPFEYPKLCQFKFIGFSHFSGSGKLSPIYKIFISFLSSFDLL